MEFVIPNIPASTDINFGTSFGSLHGGFMVIMPGADRTQLHLNIHTVKEELPLSERDISTLRGKLIPMLIFPIFVIGIFSAIYFFVLSNMRDNEIPLYVFGGFALLFMGIIAYNLWSIYADIKGGVKLSISGRITDKRINVVRRNHTNKSGRSRSAKKSYYLSIDDKEHTVDYKHYNQARVDADVVMERAPRSGVILTMEQTQVEAEPTSSTVSKASNSGRFLRSDFPDERMTAEDLTALRSNMLKAVKSKLLFMLPPLFIIVSLVVNGIGILLIFLFPLVLVMIYQIYKLILLTHHYIRNKQYNHKSYLPIIIENKSTRTSNRSSKSNRISTSIGNLSINADLYQELTVGQKIVITKPKYGKQYLSLMTFDEKGDISGSYYM